MRPLEIAVTVALLPYAVHLLLPSQGAGELVALFPFIAAVLAACHAGIEGCRWQMLPAYCLTIVFVVFECVRQLWGFHAPVLVGVFALSLDVAAIALSILLPVFKLPVPTGPYRIGTQTRHIVDKERRDPLSDEPDGARELMIQFWYPVEPSSRCPVAPYRDRRITTLKDAHFALARSRSMPGAQLSESQSVYPVLLYTPSWSGIRTECTFLVEELASHGYVVVGIDHPYSSRIVVFPDGRIARRKFSGDEDYSSASAVKAFAKTADEQVKIRARDAVYVLDTLEGLNARDPQGLFEGRLDLGRVGIFGFSLGGGTAAQACWLDRRFRVGLDMGGMIAGEAAEHGTSAPFFFMFEGMYEDRPFAPRIDLSGFDPRKRREIEFTWEQFGRMKRSLLEFGGYWMVLHGIRHRDFSDSPFFSPLRHGTVGPKRVARIIRRYAVAFFDKHLKKIEQPLLDGATSDIPEVRFEAWNA